MGAAELSLIREKMADTTETREWLVVCGDNDFRGVKEIFGLFRNGETDLLNPFVTGVADVVAHANPDFSWVVVWCLDDFYNKWTE